MDTHVAATNLSRLLSRLDSKLSASSTGTGTGTGITTTLERTKIASNLDYARQLLLTLEKSAPTLRSPAQRQTLLSKLGEQKVAIRRLNEQLQLLAHDPAHDSDSGADSDADSDADADSDTNADTPAPNDPTQQHPPTATATATAAQGLRNRHAPPTLRDQRTALFTPTPTAATTTTSLTTSPPDPETALDNHRAEQEALTASMLTLAQQLKQNSLRFGAALAREKGLLDLAAGGLDRNVLAIEGAGRKMGALRRDENVGWLWGILYPLVISALMFVVLMVLLVAPKLRWW
ncbi:hypothetical protein DFP73DRAFT_513893 [Morchella snyderi]|nr:hypothetical protein DFP73DRAFT_513893 [Morchella snyderi]